jgi:hypothetical protein
MLSPWAKIPIMAKKQKIRLQRFTKVEAEFRIDGL